jgi:hypothetical protein
MSFDECLQVHMKYNMKYKKDQLVQMAKDRKINPNGKTKYYLAMVVAEFDIIKSQKDWQIISNS